MASVQIANAEESLQKATTVFAVSLYQVLCRGGTVKNIFLSPFSIYSALGMIYLGARSTTADQIGQVLNITGKLEGPGLHLTLNQIRDVLVRSEKHTVQIASRLFGQKGSNILKTFLDGTKEFYGAEMEALDFTENVEVTRNSINSWVDEQTSGKIKDAVDGGDLPGTLLLLINAVYFKGFWKRPFVDDFTVADNFFVTPEDIKESLFMHRQDRFGYYHDAVNRCKILELRYEGDGVSMVVVLPDRMDGHLSLESALSADLLGQWVSLLNECIVDVKLPKFKFHHSIELEEPLTKLGLGGLFRPGSADLSGISDLDSLHVSRAVHKAFIDVDEEGSEAAAVTIAYIPTSPSYYQPEPDLFHADHPFPFAIRCMISGVYLFLGRVHCPEV